MGVDKRRRKRKLHSTRMGNYFKLGDKKSLLQKLDGWIRRRIRMITWKRWKKLKTRFANLRKLESPKRRAWMWANTRKSYWRTAGSPILTAIVSNLRFKQTGYLSLLECYLACNV